MIDQPRKKLFGATCPTLAERTSVAFGVHPAAIRTAILIKSTQELTVDVDDLEVGDNVTWDEVDSGVVIAANSPTVLIYEYAFLQMRVRFTPSVGNAIVYIEGRYMGHGGGMT